MGQAHTCCWCRTLRPAPLHLVAQVDLLPEISHPPRFQPQPDALLERAPGLKCAILNFSKCQFGVACGSNADHTGLLAGRYHTLGCCT